MKTKILIALLSLFSFLAQAQSLPKVSSGTIKRVENFQSKFVDARNVDIWLPEGYTAEKKYRVVYMHDGQMLFDSTQTWNQKEWKVDEVFSQLIREKKIEECIVVAIWNNGNDRISEYLPTKIFNLLDGKTQNLLNQKYLNGKGARGDNYLSFLVNEVKPYVDLNFSTYRDKDHTFMVGSSMGSIITLYAISEYPEVFCGVACLSTAWLSSIEPNFEIPLATFDYLKNKLPSPFGHKIYMDYGTGESDKPYELTQSFVDLIAKGKGFDASNYQSKVYDKDEHNEIAWSKRLHFPIEFLLAKVQPQKCSSGRIELYEDFPSKLITPRNVEVWLPEGFSPKKKYAVLYMHDGQMLYDASSSWNKQSWDGDDVAAKLMQEGKVQDFIIVGIWNGGKTRHADYFPQKPFESMSAGQRDFVSKQLQPAGQPTEIFQPVSDNYLKFLVTELKPFIDKKYPVYTDRKHTFVAGSSMGGLISMYAICEYPNVFGGAACLSTHWPGIFSMDNNPVPDSFVNYLKKNLPEPKNHKIYFDYGDQTLDAMYPPLQKNVDEVMKAKGFSGKNWETQFFPGKDHSEKSWNERLHIPMEFLLKK
ncbi:MAG: alpha/beta hydrolase-fold protein [Bacteroidia bacterium]